MPAGTQSPLGGLFAPRPASGRSFANPATSAISLVNNTAVDLFHNIAEFAGNAAVAVHDKFGSPDTALHDAASGADSSAAQSAHQVSAPDSGTKSFAAATTSAGNSANRAAGNKAQGALSDDSAVHSDASGSAGKAKNKQAPAAAGTHKGAGAVNPAADPSASPVAGNAVQGAHSDPAAAHSPAAGSAGSKAKKKQASVAAGPQHGDGSSIVGAGQSASHVAGQKLHGAPQDASVAPAAAISSTGSTAAKKHPPAAASMQSAAGSSAAATGQSTSGVANSRVQGAHPIGTAAGTSRDGSAGSMANTDQPSLPASMHKSVGSIAPATGQSPNGVANKIVPGTYQGGPAAGVANNVVQGAYLGGSAAGPSTDSTAGSIPYNDQGPPAAIRHNGIGAVVEAADQSVMNIAAKAKGHVLAVEQFANNTKSTIKGLLPASKAELQAQLQQQGNQAQAGEDDLQKELKRQDAALKEQLKQQDAKLERQEARTRKQAGKIYQQNVTITDLITQVNMNATTYNGPRIMNGTGGSTGAPALGHAVASTLTSWLQTRCVHRRRQIVQCMPGDGLTLRPSKVLVALCTFAHSCQQDLEMM